MGPYDIRRTGLRTQGPQYGTNPFPRIPFAKVEKNNFFHQAPDATRTFRKPYLFDATFEGVRNELLQPWHGTEGVKISEIQQTIVKDAEAWIKEHQATVQ